MTLQKVETSQAPKAIGPYSQGILTPAGSRFIFVSGQIPLDPITGKLIEGDIATLTRRVLANIKAILAAGGSNFDQVVRTDIFLTNLKRDFSEMNSEYGLHFTGEVKPARQTIEVSNLPMGAPIEISCIAICSV